MLEELFVINDYETNEPMVFYLTDDLNGCFQALSDVDSIYEFYEKDNKEMIKRLGRATVSELANIKFENHWLVAFERLCELKGIKIQRVDKVKCYLY